MYRQEVIELGSWVVEDGNGEVIGRFNAQTKAIDFAHLAQKADRAILVIDVSRATIRLLRRSPIEEKAC